MGKLWGFIKRYYRLHRDRARVVDAVDAVDAVGAVKAFDEITNLSFEYRAALHIPGDAVEWCTP